MQTNLFCVLVWRSGVESLIGGETCHYYMGFGAFANYLMSAAVNGALQLH